MTAFATIISKQASKQASGHSLPFFREYTQYVRTALLAFC